MYLEPELNIIDVRWEGGFKEGYIWIEIGNYRLWYIIYCILYLWCAVHITTFINGRLSDFDGLFNWSCLKFGSLLPLSPCLLRPVFTFFFAALGIWNPALPGKHLRLAFLCNCCFFLSSCKIKPPKNEELNFLKAWHESDLFLPVFISTLFVLLQNLCYILHPGTVKSLTKQYVSLCVLSFRLLLLR